MKYRFTPYVVGKTTDNPHPDRRITDGDPRQFLCWKTWPKGTLWLYRERVEEDPTLTVPPWSVGVLPAAGLPSWVFWSYDRGLNKKQQEALKEFIRVSSVATPGELTPWDRLRITAAEMGGVVSIEILHYLIDHVPEAREAALRHVRTYYEEG